MRAAKPKTAKLVKETKKAANDNTLLPLDTIIDVIAQKDDVTIIKEMSFGQWLVLEKKDGFRYSAFQKGFAQFPDAIRN